VIDSDVYYEDRILWCEQQAAMLREIGPTHPALDWQNIVEMIEGFATDEIGALLGIEIHADAGGLAKRPRDAKVAPGGHCLPAVGAKLVHAHNAAQDRHGEALWVGAQGHAGNDRWRGAASALAPVLPSNAG
jgi:hypothetical protein